MSSNNPTVNLEGPTFSSETIAPGLNLGVFGKITNTSTRKARIGLSFSARSDCDEKVYVFGGGNISLDAGRSVFFSTAWAIPRDACAGEYTVQIEAEDHKDVVASVEGSLAVT